MVVFKKPQQQQQLLLVDHQETTHLQKSREPVVPRNKFERVLDNLKVDYPGYAMDVSATREAIASDSKSKMLRLFRKMKEKQRVYDHYLNKNRHVFNTGIAALELQHPGRSDEKETRDISEEWNDNNNQEDVVVLRDKIEDGPRDKEDLYFEGRPHPTNLVVLNSVVLTYPGWEDDVHDARRSVHYDHNSFSLFQDKVHSLKVKQDLHVGDRSHWRLQKIDDLDLTYPEWEKDLEQVEEWHLHHIDNRENTITFHEVIEGMLDQQYIYLSWDYHEQLQNPFPDVDKIEAQIVHYRGSGSDCDDTKEIVDERKHSVDKSGKKKTDNKIMVDDGKNKKVVEHRSPSKYSLDYSSSSYMTVGALCAARRRSSSTKSSSHEERKESDTDETNTTRYRSSTSSLLLLPSSVSSLSSPRRQQASTENSSLPQQTGPPPATKVSTEVDLGTCDMCTTRAKTHVFVPCGHLGCAACSHHAWRTRARCPTCHQPVDKVVRIELFAPKKKK